jgi:hypothetical protein
VYLRARTESGKSERADKGKRKACLRLHVGAGTAVTGKERDWSRTVGASGALKRVDVDRGQRENTDIQKKKQKAEKDAVTSIPGVLSGIRECQHRPLLRDVTISSTNEEQV